MEDEAREIRIRLHNSGLQLCNSFAFARQRGAPVPSLTAVGAAARRQSSEAAIDPAARWREVYFLLGSSPGLT